ncbi:hypothetical protein FRC00_002002 [Tulasnella sp. 408]|nr:hypothetical protein FRC00_002002 [Tulasnella sp. 408]
MGYPVKLYVYDLSNGMARNMSFQLTGKQIDGIWHTSVVVFGREVYYGPYNAGPGIQVVLPGQSHHGRPLKIEDVGETDIDEDTFWEYISEIQQEWTGDKVETAVMSSHEAVLTFISPQYHLLDFNYLPADFLSTPFGQSMRPMIDNMFRRAVPTTSTPVPAPPNVSTLGIPSTSNFDPNTLTNPIQIAGSSASFNNLLRSNRIVVAFFTSDTCPPCGMIAPVFKQIAEDKNRPGVAFVEVNMQNSMSGAAAISNERHKGAPRNLLLTTLRLASNCFAHTTLARHVLTPSPTAISATPPRSLLTSILVPALLHDDVSTRTAAASLAFDVAAYVQKPLMEQARNGSTMGANQIIDGQSDGEWEVEMISALVEAVGKENASEEVVHRLTASLAFIVHLSPYFNDSLGPLLEVLSAKDVLHKKLEAGGCGEKGVMKDDIRRLIRETESLCSSAA